MEVIDSLSIYSNVIFCSNFFELANNEGFSVNFIDKRGEQIGRFIPQQWKKDFRTEYAQMRFVDDEKRRLKLAISFQTANIFNIRASLRYYERRSHNEKITNTIEKNIMYNGESEKSKLCECFDDVRGSGKTVILSLL